MRYGRTLWLGSAICLATLLLGCPKEPEPPTVTMEPEEAAEARRMIVEWLECEECENGELEKVTGLGEGAVPTLAATLEEGPSAASRESYRRHLVQTYNRTMEYARTHPEAELDMTEEEYVDAYMGNYVALYRNRAAIALAAIGGDYARAALEKARDAELREDVRNTVAEKLESWSQQ